MHRPWLATTLGAGAFASVFAVLPVRAALAAVNCADLPNPLVVESGDTQEPLLKALGQKLRNKATNPVSLVYITTGSCTLVDNLYGAKKLTQNPLFVPSANAGDVGGDPTWDTTKASPSCTIDPAGVNVDMGISALFVSSCRQDAPPAGLGLITGPIQGYSFVVPKASTQKAITAEEAYFAFGFGQDGGAEPWDDPTYFFIRPPTKSTILTMAAAIGVPAAKWKGTAENASSDVVTALTGSAQPEKTIGILGVEVYDGKRDVLSQLAYQAYKQRHAFWADSSPTSFDKRNLRDGHYLPWSPTVYLTQVGSDGAPSNPNAKLFIDLVLGNKVDPDPGIDGLSVVISKGLVPDCAMQVKRDHDGGDLSLYTPAAPCGCYFESKVPEGSTSCTACTADSDCNGAESQNPPASDAGTGRAHCRYGYCEAQ